MDSSSPFSSWYSFQPRHRHSPTPSSTCLTMRRPLTRTISNIGGRRTCRFFRDLRTGRHTGTSWSPVPGPGPKRKARPLWKTRAPGWLWTMPTVFDNGHDIHCGYSGTTYTYVIDFVGFASFSDTSRAYKFGLRSANSAQGGTGTGANLEAKLFTGSVNGVYYTNAIVLNCEVKPTDIEDDTVVDSGLFLIPGINPSEDVVGLKFSGSADGTQLTFYYRINYGEWILLQDEHSQRSERSGCLVSGNIPKNIREPLPDNWCGRYGSGRPDGKGHGLRRCLGHRCWFLPFSWPKKRRYVLGVGV